MAWRGGRKATPAAGAASRTVPRSEDHVPPRHGFGWDWLYGAPLILALGVIVFLCTLGLQEPELPQRMAREEPTIDRAPGLPADWAANFPQRIDQVTAAIARLPLALPAATEEPQGSGKVRWRHRLYEVSLPAPEQMSTVEELVAPLRNAAPGVTVRVTEQPAGARVQIGVDGLLTHTLALQWLGRRPRAAIIVDELGTDLLMARELADVDAPLTFAVSASAPFATEVAELARMFGRQVLVQVPMADDGPARAADPMLIPATATQAQIVEVLNRSITTLPKAVGVNNHLGAGFTADRERMRWLLDRLKEDSLFFVDSQASANSVACLVAAEISLPCAARSIEVESLNDEKVIAAQLERLAQMARSRGDAIAIVHPGSATPAGLRAAIPMFAASGVDLVPASMIVLEASLSKR